MIEEPESEALAAHLTEGGRALASSRIVLVEVPRATRIANPAPEVSAETRRLLESCLLVDVSRGLLQAAATLTSHDVRTLDAIHLATARQVGVDEMLVYDERLGQAARNAGLVVSHPGATGP